MHIYTHGHKNRETRNTLHPSKKSLLTSSPMSYRSRRSHYS